jgi:hypothetical protein
MAFKMKAKGFYKNFDFGSKKDKNKRNWTTDLYGERDFSEHNISARRTEGTIEQQRKLRNKRNVK